MVELRAGIELSPHHMRRMAGMCDELMEGKGKRVGFCGDHLKPFPDGTELFGFPVAQEIRGHMQVGGRYPTQPAQPGIEPVECGKPIGEVCRNGEPGEESPTRHGRW